MQVPPYGYAAPQTPEFSAADQSSLETLAIFHFVYAGLIALGGFIVLAAVLLGVGTAFSAVHHHGATGATGVMLGGVWVVGVLICVVAMLFLKAFLVFYSGVSPRCPRCAARSRRCGWPRFS